MTNRSLLSKIAEFILFKTKPDYMNSQEKVELFLENKSNDTFRSIFKTKEFKDMKVVSIGEKYDNSRIILYVHGGAYVNQLNLQHQIYCYILSKILKIKILLPAYPLAPKHHCTDSYEIITQLYSKLLENYGQITLMGDSAGGSFILGLCQYINEINLKKPDNVIVFSPWLDVSMKKSPDDSHDPILGNIGLKEIGKKWAGNLRQMITVLVQYMEKTRICQEHYYLLVVMKYSTRTL